MEFGLLCMRCHLKIFCIVGMSPENTQYKCTILAPWLKKEWNFQKIVYLEIKFLQFDIRKIPLLSLSQKHPAVSVFQSLIEKMPLNSTLFADIIFREVTKKGSAISKIDRVKTLILWLLSVEKLNWLSLRLSLLTRQAVKSSWNI